MMRNIAAIVALVLMFQATAPAFAQSDEIVEITDFQTCIDRQFKEFRKLVPSYPAVHLSNSPKTDYIKTVVNSAFAEIQSQLAAPNHSLAMVRSATGVGLFIVLSRSRIARSVSRFAIFLGFAMLLGDLMWRDYRGKQKRSEMKSINTMLKMEHESEIMEALSEGDEWTSKLLRESIHECNFTDNKKTLEELSSEKTRKKLHNANISRR